MTGKSWQPGHELTHAVRKGGTHHTDETVEREGKLSVFGFISLFNIGDQGIMEKGIRKFMNYEVHLYSCVALF